MYYMSKIMYYVFCVICFTWMAIIFFVGRKTNKVYLYLYLYPLQYVSCAIGII